MKLTELAWQRKQIERLSMRSRALSAARDAAVCQGSHLRRRAVSGVASHAGTSDGRTRTSGNGAIHGEADVTGAVAVVIGEVATGGVVTPARENAGCRP